MTSLRACLATIVVAALAAALAGCGCTADADKPAPSTAGLAGGAKRLRLAFITNNASDFWTIARAGTEQAKREIPEIDVDFQLPGDGTAATQKRIVDDLLARGVDGIAISPVDPANQQLMLDEVAKRCLLITHDSDAPGSARACYVGTDNLAAGRQAGERIKAALPQGGKICVFVGTLDAQNAHDRLEGIKQALAGSKVEVADVRTDDADRVRAKANALDALVKHPDVACLVGLWSYNGPAILNAVRESGKARQVKIVCFDEEDETLAGVKSGEIDATIVQQPYEFGRQAIALLATGARAGKGALPASGLQVVPTLVIDAAGVDAFAANLAKLRGRK